MFKRMHIEEAKKRPGEHLTIAGWVSRTRELSNIRFIILRDITGEIQIVVKPQKPQLFEVNLGREDVIKVEGKAVESEVAHAGIEFIPDSIEVLNRSEQPLPFDLQEKVKAELDTRLDYRFLDFRTPTTQAIFKIQSRLLTSFREYLTENGYLEIQPPCIIASASEGGAELFSIPYFETTAYLAQSPQLYKQMTAVSLEKVYTVTPIWRAEKFSTPTHLNEVRQMDIEQSFADDETVMAVLEETVSYMLTKVKEHCEDELDTLKRQLEVPEPPVQRLTYTEAIGVLQEEGEEIVWGDDFTKTQERKLTRILGQEAFFIRDWPSAQKAFYAMPHQDKPELVHAFDMLYNGIEISSGTQRIHLPELLRAQIKKKGLNPRDFVNYIDAFRYGAPPHAGWSIGLERLTMTVTGQRNIRECTMFPRDRERLVP